MLHICQGGQGVEHMPLLTLCVAVCSSPNTITLVPNGVRTHVCCASCNAVFLDAVTCRPVLWLLCRHTTQGVDVEPYTIVNGPQDWRADDFR